MTYKSTIRIATFALISAAFFFGGNLAEAATAKLHYRFYCASCHGLEGKGDGPNNTESQPVEPRDHTNAAKMSQLTDEEIIEVIKKGGAATDRSRMMPPFGDTLSKQEISELKDYLRGLCNCTAQ